MADRKTITPDELKALIDIVPLGVRVELPNGVVIDRSYPAYAVHPWWYGSGSTTTQIYPTYTNYPNYGLDISTSCG